MRVIIIALSILVFSWAHGKSVCGTIKTFSGEVTTSPRTPKKKIGGKIYQGSKVSTASESSVLIALPGINTLEIFGSTKAQITKCSFNKKKLSTVVELKLEKGDFSAKAITKSKRAKVRFVVRTPNAHLETEQAEFDVLYDDITRKTALTVNRGSAQFSLKTKTEKIGTIDVEAGETAHVYPGIEPEKKK